MARVPVTLPDGKKVALSPGGQNPLIKAIIEDFCPHFAPGGVVAYIGDTENKFAHLEADYLTGLGVSLDSAAKMPDVIIHCVKRNWLLLIEAVTSAGPVDGKDERNSKSSSRLQSGPRFRHRLRHSPRHQTFSLHRLGIRSVDR